MTDPEGRNLCVVADAGVVLCELVIRMAAPPGASSFVVCGLSLSFAALSGISSAEGAFGKEVDIPVLSASTSKAAAALAVNVCAQPHLLRD